MELLTKEQLEPLKRPDPDRPRAAPESWRSKLGQETPSARGRKYQPCESYQPCEIYESRESYQPGKSYQHPNFVQKQKAEPLQIPESTGRDHTVLPSFRPRRPPYEQGHNPMLFVNRLGKRVAPMPGLDESPAMERGR
jgi:hypothetical protein